jgi:hypothetical protein
MPKVSSAGSAIHTNLFLIEASNLDHPFLFLDLEGVSLGRQGTISILQVLVPPSRTVYLLDVHVLGKNWHYSQSNTAVVQVSKSIL